jgi:hypothetical protein
MESVIFGSVTREQIRENSQYEVRNDHIFGVSAYDSLPCVLEGETYWFGMTKTTELFSFNGANTLRKWNENQKDYLYVLSYEENGYWLPMVLEFTDKGLIVYSPSFDEVPRLLILWSINLQRNARMHHASICTSTKVIGKKLIAKRTFLLRRDIRNKP